MDFSKKGTIENSIKYNPCQLITRKLMSFYIEYF